MWLVATALYRAALNQFINASPLRPYLHISEKKKTSLPLVLNALI